MLRKAYRRLRNWKREKAISSAVFFNRSKISSPIYIVGYPKSGNTWTTRLMADILQSPVVSYQGIELASEINMGMTISDAPRFGVLKSHLLPEELLEVLDPDPRRILYIYRDFRDVAISAFFYKHRCKESDFVSKRNLTIVDEIWISVRGCRKKLSEYVARLTTEGWSSDTGTWSHHVQSWKAFERKNPIARVAFVSYEQMLLDTSATLQKIFFQLELPEPLNEKMNAAIERQSFSTLKKRFSQLPENAILPYGKKHNIKFLRRGQTRDWETYFTEAMGQVVQKHHGELLFDLGYETNPHWYEQV